LRYRCSAHALASDLRKLGRHQTQMTWSRPMIPTFVAVALVLTHEELIEFLILCSR
jgi:hypothetical protein